MNIIEIIPHMKSIQAKYGITEADTFVQQSNGDYRGLRTDIVVPKKEYKKMEVEINTLLRHNLS
jgi:hypothetical protein